MKTTKALIYLFVIISFLGSCTCNSHKNKPSLKEDFETAKKTGYTNGSIGCTTGSWYFADAIVGAGADDPKDGNRAVRIRNNGELRMNFDVNGATTVTVQHAVFGHDGPSTWQLSVSDNGGISYTAVGSSITSQSHSLQTATFTVNKTGRLRFKIDKLTGGSNRINIDDFTISNEPVTTPNNPGNTVAPKPGDTTSVSGDNGNLLLGNPSAATTSTTNPDNYLLDAGYYIESYNRDKGEPNWVAWHLGSTDLGQVKRLNNFRPNTSLPAGWYEVQSSSYTGTGFERGHNCPSADRTSNSDANSATFLMTNIIPQAPHNNEDTWANLEQYERQLVQQGNEVFIIVGSYGSGGTGSKGYYTTIDHGRINVPSNFWKVIVAIPDGHNDLSRIDASVRVIAVNTPNDNSIDPDWTKYICTVSDIEKATGYHLFSSLPQSIQVTLKSKKDAGDIGKQYHASY